MENDPARKAIELVDGDRQKDYGHPFDDFTKTAAIWSAILSKKLKMDIDPEEVALCMIGVKLSREANRPTFDNLVDICGYARTTQMVYDERERRKKESWNEAYKNVFKTDKTLFEDDRHKHIPSDEELRKESEEKYGEIKARSSLFEDPSRSEGMTDEEIETEIEKAMEGPSLFEGGEEVLSQNDVDALLKGISGREFDDEEKEEKYIKYKETRETIKKINEDLHKDPYYEERNKDNTG